MNSIAIKLCTGTKSRVVPNPPAFGPGVPDFLGLPQCIIVGGRRAARTAQEPRKQVDATQPSTEALERSQAPISPIGDPFPAARDPRRHHPPPAFGGRG